MYDVLGDWAAQEAIRERTPAKKHCTLLMPAANACLYCPKNPYREIKRRDWREFARLLDESNFVLRLIDTGFTVDPWKLPWETTLATVISHGEREKLRAERIKQATKQHPSASRRRLN